jgi:hypothetical protein
MIPYYCPDEFQVHPSNPQSCVVKCPKEKGYDLRLFNNEAVCVNTDETVMIRTPVVAALQKTENIPYQLTLADMATGVQPLPVLYQLFANAKTTFDENFAIVDGNIDKGKKLQLAFNDLQEAENVRDINPQAYQNARIRYYTLLKGDEWLNEEKERIAKAEVEPVLNDFKSRFDDLINRFNQQSNTLQIVDGVRDKLGSLRDDYYFTVGTFTDQLAELKNQIQIEKRNRTEPQMSPLSWINTVLNVLIIFGIISAILLIYRKFIRPKPITPSINT